MSDDDRRRGAYAPPPDDYETFDARDAEQDRRGWLFLAAAAVVFALFVAVVYNTFQLGVRERSDSPVIAANTEPYRVAPEDDTAEEPELGVYSLRSGGRDSEDAPAARETSEEPVALPQARVETADADALAGDEDAPARTVRDEPAPAETSEADQPEPAPATAEPARAAEEAGEEEAQPSIEDLIAEREREIASPPDIRQPETREPEPAPRASERDASAGDRTGGPYLAQIAAFRSEEDALDAWSDFAGRNPDLAAGRRADIQRADLGERGIYHRLRIDGFDSREAANEYCQTLQTRGQACLVARR